MEDTSYLFSPYGRQKELECYDLEMREREEMAREKELSDLTLASIENETKK